MRSIPSKYEPIIKILRESLIESGGSLCHKPEDYGLNTFYRSKSGGIELTFDYGAVHDLVTQEGTITPFGSHGCGNSQKLLELLQERLGLVVIVPQRDDKKIDELTFQLQISGPIYEITRPLYTPPFDKSVHRMKMRMLYFWRRIRYKLWFQPRFWVQDQFKPLWAWMKVHRSSEL